MSEKRLEAKTIKKARELGFLTYKFSSPSNRGVPDRIFISPRGKIFFIEFKSAKGKLSKLQEHEINKLRNHQICADVICNFEDAINILYHYI